MNQPPAPSTKSDIAVRVVQRNLKSLLTLGSFWVILEATTPHPLKAMSEEQLKAFMEVAKADAGLQEKLKEAADVDAVVEIAKAAGFVISVEKLKNAPVAELSDEDLEGVAGGATGLNFVFCECGYLIETWL